MSLCNITVTVWTLVLTHVSFQEKERSFEPDAQSQKPWQTDTQKVHRTYSAGVAAVW